MSIILERLQENFAKGITATQQNFGMLMITAERSRACDILKFLKEDEQLAFELLLDICGVDYLGQSPRFELVYHLYSFLLKTRVRVKVKVGEDDMHVASVTSLWEAANWFEREAYDLFGFGFKGHPNLRRILTWDEFAGHALRKDYPAKRRQPIPTLRARILP